MEVPFQKATEDLHKELDTITWVHSEVKWNES
jgi:hypothetical protein